MRRDGDRYAARRGAQSLASMSSTSARIFVLAPKQSDGTELGMQQSLCIRHVLPSDWQVTTSKTCIHCIIMFVMLSLQKTYIFI